MRPNTGAEEGAKLASAAGFDVEPLAHHVDRPVLITRLVRHGDSVG
jgi:hypothetical protein